MKKGKDWVAVLLLVVWLTPINAQPNRFSQMLNFSAGFKAEANWSGFIFSGSAEAESRMDIGGEFGFFAKTDWDEHFSEQGEILLSYRTSTIVEGGRTGRYRYWGIEIPFYGVGRWKTKKGCQFYCGAGPSVEYGLSAKYRVEGIDFDLYADEVNFRSGSMTKLTIGAAAIFGYEFNCGIQMNAGCKIGLANAFDQEHNCLAIYPCTISFGFAYRFI